jgi:hypothetical protein
LAAGRLAAATFGRGDDWPQRRLAAATFDREMFGRGQKLFNV